MEKIISVMDKFSQEKKNEKFVDSVFVKVMSDLLVEYSKPENLTVN